MEIQTTERLYKEYQDKMREHVNLSYNCISPSQARWVLSRYKIPREEREPIIRKMIRLGLLQRKNKNVLIIVSS